MAMAMIAVALMALMSSVVSSMTLIEINRQEAIALSAARTKISEIEAYDFDNVFADYKSGAKSTFSIAGISNPPTQQVGRVVFPTNGSANLDETLSDASFSGLNFPRDLNLDGDSSDTNVNASFVILPIKVRIQWESVQGLRTIEYKFIISKLK